MVPVSIPFHLMDLHVESGGRQSELVPGSRALSFLQLTLKACRCDSVAISALQSCFRLRRVHHVYLWRVSCRNTMRGTSPPWLPPVSSKLLAAFAPAGDVDTNMQTRTQESHIERRQRWKSPCILVFSLGEGRCDSKDVANSNLTFHKLNFLNNAPLQVLVFEPAPGQHFRHSERNPLLRKHITFVFPRLISIPVESLSKSDSHSLAGDTPDLLVRIEGRRGSFHHAPSATTWFVGNNNDEQAHTIAPRLASRFQRLWIRQSQERQARQPLTVSESISRSIFHKHSLQIYHPTQRSTCLP